MVVSSHAEYEERAVLLGTDHALRRALTARLRAARATCPLFDTERWVSAARHGMTQHGESLATLN